MSSIYYLFLNLAIGSFALSVLCIRGQRMKNRHANEIDLRLDTRRRHAAIGIGRFATVPNSDALLNNETSCVCIPESPYRFMNMWEIISETSLESRQGQ